VSLKIESTAELGRQPEISLKGGLLESI